MHVCENCAHFFFSFFLFWGGGSVCAGMQEFVHLQEKFPKPFGGGGWGKGVGDKKKTPNLRGKFHPRLFRRCYKSSGWDVQCCYFVNQRVFHLPFLLIHIPPSPQPLLPSSLSFFLHFPQCLLTPPGFCPDLLTFGCSF